MTLRVFFENKQGETEFQTWGLNAENIEAVLKTEVLEDSEKLKTWSGSKYVGLEEFDNPKETPKKTIVKPKKKTKLPEYEIFNDKVHDTDREYYWVSALCSNCNDNAQVAIPRKQKIDKRGFKCLSCPKCGVEKSLNLARYDYGKKKYFKVGKK